MPKRTVSLFAKMKRERNRIVMLTAYDAPTAALADHCGVDLLLVGDSVGMAVLGYPSTIYVKLEESLHHCRAVRRGAPNAFIVGDMPFMTYNLNPEQAMLNAAKYIQDAGCDAVKIEGGLEMVPTVQRMVQAGIPVMPHIGLRPQQVQVQGGYKIAGRSEEAVKRLLEEAHAFERSGAFAIVLECMPAPLAKQITEELSIPTIGIGAGPDTDGQVQVVNDILGLFTEFVPKHAKRYANLTDQIAKAFTDYVSEVRSGVFPDAAHSHEK